MYIILIHRRIDGADPGADDIFDEVGGRLRDGGAGGLGA